MDYTGPRVSMYRMYECRVSVGGGKPVRFELGLEAGETR